MYWKEVIGMQKYKDELQRFSLSEEDKMALKQAVLHQENACHQQKKRIPYMRYATLAVSLLLVMVVSLFLFRNKGITGDSGGVNFQLSELVQTTKYTPQAYQIGGAGGLGGAKTGTANTYTYGGFLIDEKPTSLPVYDMYEPEAEVKNANLIDILNKFEPDKEIQLKGMNVYNDEMLSAILYPTGEIIVTLQTPIDVEYDSQKDPFLSEFNNNIDFMMTHVDTYVKQYLKPFGFTDVTYSVLKDDIGGAEILITQKGGNRYDNAKETKKVTFKINAEAVQENEMKLYPSFSFSTSINISVIDEYPIYTQEEATSILLRGGYYKFGMETNYIFTKDDILYADIIYENFNKSLKEHTMLYKLPCYRFFVNIDGRTVALDVIATKQEYLRTLDKMTWYMDQ